MKTDKELVQIIDTFIKREGYVPTCTELLELKLATKRDFQGLGGYKKFLGINFPDSNRRRKFDPEKLKEDIKKDMELLFPSNKSITVRKLLKLYEEGKTAYTRFFIEKVFNSWNEFLSYCGYSFNKDVLRAHSKEEIRDKFLDYYKSDIPTIQKLRMDYDKGKFPFQYGHLKTIFGSYNKFMEFCEVAPRSASSFNHHCIALDGHMCNSYSERAVDDFFYQNGISHKKEVYYKELGVKTHKKLRTDWVLSDGTVVEFCGMMRIKDYANRVDEKKMLLSQHEISSKFLDYEDLSKLNEIFKEHLGGDEHADSV